MWQCHRCLRAVSIDVKLKGNKKIEDLHTNTIFYTLTEILLLRLEYIRLERSFYHFLKNFLQSRTTNKNEFFFRYLSCHYFSLLRQILLYLTGSSMKFLNKYHIFFHLYRINLQNFICFERYICKPSRVYASLVMNTVRSAIACRKLNS